VIVNVRGTPESIGQRADQSDRLGSFISGAARSRNASRSTDSASLYTAVLPPQDTEGSRARPTLARKPSSCTTGRRSPILRAMRLSFVIPTRNHARFIRKCIDSCLEQGIADAEVLVVDGLSTDGTQEILASYGESIRWISEKDRGQSDALNKGIRQTSGEIVAWINSDDYYPHPGVLCEVLARFDADPLLEVVYGDGVVVDTEYNTIRALPAPPTMTARSILLFAGAVVSQPSLFFRRELFLAVGGVDESLHFTMDYDLWIRMFERARKAEYLPALLSCTTSHQDAKTIRGMLHQIHEVGQIKRRHAPRFHLGPLEKARLWGGLASMYVYWAVTRAGLKRVA
jgi:glycosyltransferase involved in cell wall biosynthesis